MLRAVAEKFIRVRKSAKIKKDPERVWLRVLARWGICKQAYSREKSKKRRVPATRLRVEALDLVKTSGLEPPTPCMSSRYSNQLSYAFICCFHFSEPFIL